MIHGFKTLEESWKDYAKKVLPPDTGHEQRTQTQMAFYAGASIVIETVAAVGDENLPEDKATEVFGTIHDETVNFARAKVAESKNEILKAVGLEREKRGPIKRRKR